MHYSEILSEVIERRILSEHYIDVVEFAEGLTSDQAETLLVSLSEDEWNELLMLAEEIPAYEFFLARLGMLGKGLFGAAKAGYAGRIKGWGGGILGGLAGVGKHLKGMGGAIKRQGIGGFFRDRTPFPNILKPGSFKPRSA